MQLKDVSRLKKEIENILNDNKAIEIKSINLKDKTSIADFMIIASGNSSRHIQALSEILINGLKKKGIDNCHLEGRDSNDWKLIDARDIIVHIFHPEKRKFYNLEKMWSQLIPVEKLKKKGIQNCRLEGHNSNEWKLIDAIDIIIHIFHPEKRKFYNLERMWSELIPKERVTI